MFYVNNNSTQINKRLRPKKKKKLCIFYTPPPQKKKRKTTLCVVNGDMYLALMLRSWTSGPKIEEFRTSSSKAVTDPPPPPPSPAAPEQEISFADFTTYPYPITGSSLPIPAAVDATSTAHNTKHIMKKKPMNGEIFIFDSLKFSNY